MILGHTMRNCLLISAFLLILLNSCGFYKRYTYIQPPIPVKNDTILYQRKLLIYKIQPNDVLYIKIQSQDKIVTELFNSNGSNSNQSMMGIGGGNMYLMGNPVDKDGYINLPIIGKVHIAGLTVTEAQDTVQKLATVYISDARTDVKLVSFKISMLGEINGKGSFTIYADRANILEAIAQAGDISYNGNRKKVLIIRSFNEGSRIVTVDLTKRELLSSEQYYLQPNDIIYVEPLKTAIFKIKIADYSVFLSIITSTVAVVLLVANLTKK